MYLSHNVQRVAVFGPNGDYLLYSLLGLPDSSIYLLSIFVLIATTTGEHEVLSYLKSVLV